MSQQLTTKSPSLLSNLPALPLKIVTRDGQTIDLSGSVWKIRKTSDGGDIISIDWDSCNRKLRTDFLSLRAIHLFKLYIADRIARKSPSAAGNAYQWLLFFLRWCNTHIAKIHFDWTDLSEGLCRTFLDYSVSNTHNKGNYFSCLRSFYEWGVARQYPDFSRDFLLILKSITAIGNSKGHHVRFRDPLKGPFSPDEKLFITQAVTAKKGDEQDRIIVMIFLELGLNSLATTRLRNEDLKSYRSEGAVFYQIDVPRMKKRTARRETKARPISARLGELLTSQQTGGEKDHLLHWLDHSHPQGSIVRAMRQFTEAAVLVSPRTNNLLHLSPRRFRYTLATQMAEEGAPAWLIAEILDHSDLQNIHVYIETASTIADHVERATEQSLKPLVNRFLGRFATAEEEQGNTTYPLIPAAAPQLPLLNTGGIGLCGHDTHKKGPCQRLPPLSCYSCVSFIPLRSGPHQEMLDSIDAFAKGLADNADVRIGLQLENTRSAIADVIANQKSISSPE